jgi:hypothetical protein
LIGTATRFVPVFYTEQCVWWCRCDRDYIQSSVAGPSRNAMPHWMLSCRNCHKNFVHSEIQPQSNDLLYDSLWPYRPEFPEGGLSVECPHCQQAATYQRFELMYRSGVRDCTGSVGRPTVQPNSQKCSILHTFAGTARATLPGSPVSLRRR